MSLWKLVGTGLAVALLATLPAEPSTPTAATDTLQAVASTAVQPAWQPGTTLGGFTALEEHSGRTVTRTPRSTVARDFASRPTAHLAQLRAADRAQLVFLPGLRDALHHMPATWGTPPPTL